MLSGFPRRCGLRAADDFFTDRPVRPCAAPPAIAFRPCRPSRVRWQRCPPNRRSAASGTVTAVGLTLADALDQLLSASLLAGFEQSVMQVGGLRPGYVRAGEEPSRCTA